MKICRVSNSYPNDKRPGSGLVPFYLSKYSPEPSLYITRKLDSKKKVLPKHVALKEISYNEVPTPDNIRKSLQATESRKYYSKLWTLFRFAGTLRGLVFLLKSLPILISYKPEIVACHQSLTILHGIFSKYCLGSKFILHIHNNSEIVAMKNLWLLKVLVQRADLIFCLTKNMGRELETFLPSMVGKIRYTSTGVNPVLFRDLKKKRKNQLIAIGYFRWQKGHSYLLEAVSSVFRQYPEYSLIIVGDGPEKGAIINKIEELGITGKVELPGVVPRERVMELLNESKIFVMPSLSEGLPKVLLEALACGTPAVITTGCNATDIIQDRGIVVRTKDSQALAGAIRKMLENKELWQMYSENARAIVEEFSWEKVAHKVYHYYNELVKH
jgi:glycosyltransferase involved in cell wall biosynthesis